VIFEPALESLPREQLQALQLERLRALAGRVRERVPLYAERLADVEPGDLRSLDDLRRRSDDMLIIRGVNVYPSQVGTVIGRVPELSPHFGLVVPREGTLDEVEVLAEVNDEALLGDGSELRDRVAALIRDTIGCTMAVTPVAPGEAPRSDGGKIQRVRDLR
jgi:phenylacetate-coenzyme A ligase PaaK-like adenylate-forming protein